jgi:hypothetical protein
MIEDWLVSLKLGLCGRNNLRCSLVTFFHFARSRHYLPKGEATEADDIPKVKEATMFAVMNATAVSVEKE